VAAFAKMIEEAHARVEAAVSKLKNAKLGVVAKVQQEQSKSLIEQLASTEEAEKVKETQRRENQLSHLAQEQRRALEQVVADRERLLQEKEEQLRRQEEEYAARLEKFAKQQAEQQQTTLTSNALRTVSTAIRRVHSQRLWRGWNTWRKFVAAIKRAEQLTSDRSLSLKRIMRFWRLRQLTAVWKQWHKAVMVSALEDSVKVCLCRRRVTNHRLCARLI